MLVAFPVCTLTLMMTEVSGWDKTAAVAAVIAASIAVLGTLGWLYGVVRSQWPIWRSKRSADLQTDGYAFVNTTHEETVTVRLRRDVFCHTPSLALRDSAVKRHVSFELPGVRWWTGSGWLDAEGNPHQFPKRLRRGDQLRATLHVDGKQPWKGVICAEAYDEGDCAFQVRRSFEVYLGAEGVNS